MCSYSKSPKRTASRTHRGRHPAAKTPPHSVSRGDKGGPRGRKWRGLSKEVSLSPLSQLHLPNACPSTLTKHQTHPQHRTYTSNFQVCSLAAGCQCPPVSPRPALATATCESWLQRARRPAMGRAEGHMPLARSLRGQPSYPRGNLLIDGPALVPSLSALPPSIPSPGSFLRPPPQYSPAVKSQAPTGFWENSDNSCLLGSDSASIRLGNSGLII